MDKEKSVNVNVYGLYKTSVNVIVCDFDQEVRVTVILWVVTWWLADGPSGTCLFSLLPIPSHGAGGRGGSSRR